jgi:hypothetical protein
VRFKLLGKDDFLAMRDEKHQWFIKNLLPVTGTTIVFGAPGEGKSTICLDMALALENGLPFGGDESLLGDFGNEQVRTAWLSFEDGWDYELKERLLQRDPDLRWPLAVAEPTAEMWTDATVLKLDGSQNPIEMTNGFTASTQSHWDELGTSLKAQGVRVLFIDTLSELAGSDATTRQVQDVFGHLSQWRRRYQITVVLIGHSSSHKDNFGKKKTELLGVTAWVAKARHTVLVAGNTTTTFANVQKSNRGPVGFNVTFQKVDGGPVMVTSTNTQNEYVEERKKSTQKRDWDKRRAQAVKARATGPSQWGSLEALGAAAGGSKTVGKNLVAAGFFRESEDGGYEPVDVVIDGEWEQSQAA